MKRRQVDAVRRVLKQRSLNRPSIIRITNSEHGEEHHRAKLMMAPTTMAVITRPMCGSVRPPAFSSSSGRVELTKDCPHIVLTCRAAPSYVVAMSCLLLEAAA